MTRLLTLGVMVFAAVALCVWGPSYGSATDGWPRADQGVVPYAPLPPAGEKIPTTRVAASPAPAPAGTPACRARQLRARLVDVGGATGTMYAAYRLRLVSGHACAVTGRPRLTALEHGHPAPVGFTPHDLGFMTGHWHGAVLVDGSHAAQVMLSWNDNDWCAPPVNMTGMLIALPGQPGSVHARGLGRFAGCAIPDAPPSVQPPPMELGTFYPAHFKPAHRVSAWHPVRVVDLADLPSVQAGDTFDLPVTLRATRDVPLDVCPDYTVTMYGMRTGPDTITATHQLNCAGVTTVGVDGVPYLPRGVPVTFEIELVAPASSVPKLIWQISGRSLSLTAGYDLTVTPAPSASPSA